MRSGHLITAVSLAIQLIGCGGESPSGPQLHPTSTEEDAYVFTVMCDGCPGLTNVEIDRSVVPHRARLGVGRQTSLRAVSANGCRDFQGTLQVARWIVSDPSVIELTPSSSESAIVKALRPGVADITADRELPDGTSSPIGLRDSFAPDLPSGCAALPALVLQVVP
jgi:hypothetical protein